MPRRVNVLRLQLFTCLIKPFEIRVPRLFIDNIYKRVIMRIILYNIVNEPDSTFVRFNQNHVE